MRSKDVMIGMKVSPHFKSVGVLSPDDCMSYLGNPQYLTVRRWEKFHKVWILTRESHNSPEMQFKSKDFEPYIEEGE